MRELALLGEHRFVIGFEVAKQPADGKVTRLGLTFENATVEQILLAMCSADRRYTYAENQPGVIKVRPVVQQPELRELMDLPVPSVDVHTQAWYPNLFYGFPRFVPPLSALLDRKERDWAKRTGRVAPGSAGFIMRTNLTPPTISIRVENTTVRGVLNAFAAYTLAHAASDRIEGIVLCGTGWRVEFLPDPQAATGLGGYVKWSAFP